jgi:flagellar motor protein MotB
MSIQSFFVNLLSLVLLIILVGFSFLIADRLVLQGRYTNPYNKDEVIKSLGERLNLQVQENNQLKNQLRDTQSTLETVQNKLESMPPYQLNRTLMSVMGSRSDVDIEKGRLVFKEQTFFESGSDKLTPSAKKSLDKILLHLLRLTRDVKFPWVLRIEGHTDSQTTPDQNGYHSNWMISYKRAYAVGQYFISKGLDAKRLYMAGFSSYNRGPHPNNKRVKLSFDYI